MSLARHEIEARVENAIRTSSDRQGQITREDSLVLKLGFDSLRIATLAIALEEELDRPILLNDWIATCTDPTTLTVGSLCDFVWHALERDN
ncbi:MAG: acyl carrier protein [Myxococcota bacterium]